MNKTEVDVVKYNELFGYGSSPTEWGDKEIPSIDEIFNYLKLYLIERKFNGSTIRTGID